MSSTTTGCMVFMIYFFCNVYGNKQVFQCSWFFEFFFKYLSFYWEYPEFKSYQLLIFFYQSLGKQEIVNPQKIQARCK